jgi:catechol 2,3-dioxygenase-like lactoylglutathione lyase family enzyme
MSSTQSINQHAASGPAAEKADLKLEVVVIPVSDVDRARHFYERLGWRLDADFASAAHNWRVVQMTPPGSPCSVMFGKGFTSAAPGSFQGTMLVVDDLNAARTELIGRGVEVTDVFHFEGDLLNTRSQGRTPGRDPKNRSYFSFASFNDPDGNGWLLQEVTTRFPGRGFSSDVSSLTELLQEAEKRHGAYEPTGPKHHWSDWYAAYIVARERGRSAEEAAEAGALRIERTREGVQV